MPRLGYLLPTRERVMEGHPEIASLLALAERAEALGFDSVWVGDSLLARPRHDPLTLLAAAAARTRRVERLSENFSIFDFKLSTSEMAAIDSLGRRDGRIVDFAFSGSPHRHSSETRLSSASVERSSEATSQSSTAKPAFSSRETDCRTFRIVRPSSENAPVSTIASSPM